MDVEGFSNYLSRLKRPYYEIEELLNDNTAIV